MTPAIANPQNGYQTLLNVWNATKDLPKSDDNSLANLSYGFWHAGNTLDTFMDYYRRAQPPNYKADAAARTEEAILVFQKAVSVNPLDPHDQPPTAAWWDDYGWWGVAFIKAFSATTSYRYLQCAKTCWDFMEMGGRQYKPQNPYEKGGTWNHDPYDIKSPGVQNLITNSLFLNLSSQLYGLTHEDRYLTGACDQFAWFYHWFTQGALAPVTPGGSLVYPSCGINVSVNDQSIQNNKGSYWTGDQGAVMGALAQLLIIANAASQKIKNPPNLANYLADTCDSIANAVSHNDQMVYQNKGVLYEQSWNDLNGAVGKGVLMRYFGAWVSQRGIVSSDRKFIGDNALAATTNPEKDGYFRYSWANAGRTITTDGFDTLKQLTRQCAGQDAYNAFLLI